MIKPYELAQRKKVTLATVYGWIQKRIIPPDKVKSVEKTVTRLEIDDSVIENELKEYPKDRGVRKILSI